MTTTNEGPPQSLDTTVGTENVNSQNSLTESAIKLLLDTNEERVIVRLPLLGPLALASTYDVPATVDQDTVMVSLQGKMNNWDIESKRTYDTAAEYARDWVWRVFTKEFREITTRALSEQARKVQDQGLSESVRKKIMVAGRTFKEDLIDHKLGLNVSARDSLNVLSKGRSSSVDSRFFHSKFSDHAEELISDSFSPDFSTVLFQPYRDKDNVRRLACSLTIMKKESFPFSSDDLFHLNSEQIKRMTHSNE